MGLKYACGVCLYRPDIYMITILMTVCGEINGIGRHSKTKNDENTKGKSKIMNQISRAFCQKIVSML